jgi:hypothetical protein
MDFLRKAVSFIANSGALIAEILTAGVKKARNVLKGATEPTLKTDEEQERIRESTKKALDAQGNDQKETVLLSKDEIGRINRDLQKDHERRDEKTVLLADMQKQYKDLTGEEFIEPNRMKSLSELVGKDIHVQECPERPDCVILTKEDYELIQKQFSLLNQENESMDQKIRILQEKLDSLYAEKGEAQEKNTGYEAYQASPDFEQNEFDFAYDERTDNPDFEPEMAV